MKLNKGLIAAAVVAPLVQFSASLQAAPVFGPPGSFNSIELVAVENQYRATADCTPGDCIPTPDGIPAGFSLVNPGIPNNTDVGDLFIGIMNIRDISNNLTGTTWNSDNVAAGGIDTFTGYFVQEVTANFLPPDPFDPTQTSDNHIALGASSVGDPFGILTTPGEMFALFVDDGSQATGGTTFSRNGFGGGGISADIGRATDGDLWATLGDGSVGLCDEPNCTPGYSYTHTNDALTGGNIEGTFFFALNGLSHGPAYNLGDLLPINDVTEAENGGFATPGVTGTCAPLSPLPITCTEFVGQAELTANQAGPIFMGNEPWYFENNDPINFFVAVPEPNSMALLGLALVGFSALQKRRGRRNDV